MGIQSTKRRNRMKKGDFIGEILEANLAKKAIFDQCTTPLSRISNKAHFLNPTNVTYWPAVED
jgi:hypothetical protein